jgi:K+-sensing histidine kinase KdpD
MNSDRLVLVCVTAQKSSQGLVKAGKRIADGSKASLEVVSVLPISDEDNKIDTDIIEKLHQLSKSCGGNMAVYFSDDPILTVSAHIAKRKPLTIVTGFPGENSNNFINLIHSLFPNITISMVDKEETVYNMVPEEKAAH